MGSYSQYERNFEANPKRFVWKGLLWLLGLSIVFGSIGYGLGWFSEAAEVVKEEFGPKAALKKYEWFKDASETLNEKRNTIMVYESNLKDMKEDYKEIPRFKWADIDKQQYNQWRMEITGIKASYNKVAKEYNSQSSKFNWSSFNTSNIPETYDLYLTQ